MKFDIDHIELMFLAEACIPPVPIARASFWQNLTDKYWKQMTVNQRGKLFEFLNRNERYKESLKNKDEDVLLFHARYDPNNQYVISVEFNGSESIHDAFLWLDKYHINIRTHIAEEYITKIERK